jgi:hypothetical protein
MSSSARASFACATSDKSSDHTKAQFEIFARRCLDLADAVAENRIAFLDAIDVAYDGALESGLIASVGDNIVQACMAAAFANARRPA